MRTGKRILTSEQKALQAKRGRAYYLAHPERCKAATALYQSKNFSTLRTAAIAWQLENLNKLLFYSARKRARSHGIAFSITTDDIFIPSFCPVLGIPLFRGSKTIGNNSPTLDRIHSARGYIPGNIVVMSALANRIKSSETDPSIFRAVADWLEHNIKGG